jgi:superfamily II DNA/RNA helicase
VLVRGWRLSARFNSSNTGNGSLSGDGAFKPTSEEFYGPFTALGLRPQIIDALQKAFPNVQAPTKVQQKFITAVNDGMDVMLKDATGTGK